MVGTWSCEDEDYTLDPIAPTHDKNMVSHRNFGIVLDKSSESAGECTCHSPPRKEEGSKGDEKARVDGTA